jgi:hypothetical protein
VWCVPCKNCGVCFVQKQCESLGIVISTSREHGACTAGDVRCVHTRSTKRISESLKSLAEIDALFIGQTWCAVNVALDFSKNVMCAYIFKQCPRAGKKRF